MQAELSAVYDTWSLSFLRNAKSDRNQSSLAIISSFDIGLKLSISSPLAARPDRRCDGTSFEFRWGAIESSVEESVLQYQCFVVIHTVA